MEHREDFVDELEFSHIAPKRTTLLTVLCILTWSYSLVSFLFIVVFLKWSTFRADQYEFILNAVAGPVLCSAGAVLMFNLNKIGFIVYLAGALIPMAFDVLQELPGRDLTESNIIYLILRWLPTIAFTVLYAVNLSGMKPLKK
jgi:hypothetical protein